MTDSDKGFEAYTKGDYATALREWQHTAKQGNVIAQYNLGIMYAHGLGVSQDYHEAIKWYDLSAKQGYTGAQISLGEIYAKGQNGAQDFVIAFMWYNLAASKGNEYGAELRDLLATQMTSEQIAQAQKLAHE